MAEYIDREAVLENVCVDCCENGGCNVKCAEYLAMKAIPAADVVPVVSSHWEDVSVKITLTSDDEGSMLIASMFCPNCKRWHNEVYHYGSPTEMAHYCPNCGARMDESEDEK